MAGRRVHVSIHALLAECDLKQISNLPLYISFNPRTPCGVRRPPGKRKQSWKLFQSTHSLRSATQIEKVLLEHCPVSIHALLAECDSFLVQSVRLGGSFNPRTPCGVRLLPCLRSLHEGRVSIHALLAECDSSRLTMFRTMQRFNPRTPCGVRPYWTAGALPVTRFQSTHSLRSATL